MSTASLSVVEGAPSPRHRRRRKPQRPRTPPAALRPLHRIWRRTLDDLEVVPVTLPVCRLASTLEGVVACQISDFHLDRDEDVARLQAAVKAINRQQPDFVFLTGDYFSGGVTMRRYVDEFRRTLAELKPGVGTYAILGNHDHWASETHITAALKGAGARVLANDNDRVTLRGERVAVVGVDDLWARRAEPARAFRGVPPDDCSIVLAHNPDTALYIRHLRPGVMLSGHTHGGVVRIPYYGSLIRSMLRIGKQYCAGLNRYHEFYIYTNRGLGTFWLRIRINCRPEVSRFMLISAAAVASQAGDLIDESVVHTRGRHRRMRAHG